MNIALASMFRNSTRYLDRYFAQVGSLKLALEKQGHTFRVIAAEADSEDETAERLFDRIGDLNITVVNRDNGSQWFGSIDHPDRWKAISYVCDGILEQVRNTDDALIYVESDLIWNVDTMLALLERIGKPEVDACAAMCFHNGTDIFYDVWGHRKAGIRFTPSTPYHPMLDGKMTQIDSAGSCIVMRGIVARNARFVPPEMGIFGFCGDVRGRGFKLWLDPSLKVEHP